MLRGNVIIKPADYVINNEELLNEYESVVRNTLKYGLFRNADASISDIIPFVRDGVINPDVWFNETNDFRPLFILKEVSCGKDYVSQLDEYRLEWNNMTRFEFVNNPYDDVRLGSFSVWVRIAQLAYGLCEMHYNEKMCDYYEIKKKIEYSKGDMYPGSCNDPYYVHEKYRYRTANKVYDAIMDRIAVIEIKKLFGGTRVDSQLSQASGWYLDHISEEHEELQLLFERQIDLINPTVIVCCGVQMKQCISTYLPKNVRLKYGDNIIDGVHPNRGSTEQFYYVPIKKYAEMRKGIMN